METKEIIEKLNNFCESFFSKNVVEMDVSLFKEAAERLEELEAELGKRTINDRPYGWISVEDDLPKESGKLYWVYRKNGSISLAIFYNEKKPYWSHGDATHWFPLPEPPKPKAQTFKDIFLKAFPKVVVLPKSGVPVVCAKQVFQQLGDDESPCDMCCAVCWNHPYFETEEEGGADADNSK